MKIHLLVFLLSAHSLTEEPEEIMERSMERLMRFKENMDRRSEKAVADLQKVGETFSGPQLFQAGKRIIDNLIEEDGSPVI